jgi:hypothetical protein
MTALAFELIDKSTFRVGDKVLSGHFCDPPLNGKYRYVTDGTSDERDRIGQHLFIHDFRDVRPVDLPNGISINIQNPKSEFRQVNFAEIKKVNDQSELTVILCFDYVDWHLPLNLQHFAERYSNALLRQMDSAMRCHIDQTEVGLFINCSIAVAPEMNFLSAYRRADAQILSIYRKCLADIYNQQHQPKEVAPTQAEENTGSKWWFRYVIVPVIGSGTVAAVAAGLMSLLK